MALYVLATGITDPDKICADLKLRSRISAESALSFWAGAGLLERYEENAAPGAEPSAPAPMTWAEIAAASRTDPMISSLIDCAQTGFARPLTHRAGGFCAGDRDAVRGLCGQLRQAHHGCRGA